MPFKMGFMTINKYLMKQIRGVVREFFPDVSLKVEVCSGNEAVEMSHHLSNVGGRDHCLFIKLNG